VTHSTPDGVLITRPNFLPMPLQHRSRLTRWGNSCDCNTAKQISPANLSNHSLTTIHSHLPQHKPTSLITANEKYTNRWL